MRGGTKQKGTLIYDGSARPSTVSTNGPLSTETGNKGGAGSAIVLAKSNVPFVDNIISQELQTGKTKTPSQCRTPEPKSGTNCKGI